ncbi:MAG TPA: hypothetical protein VFE65_24170 [Pseudonocardia sp.]|nr:hypothetical protein [Pseudonocardia sp.]
MTTTGTDQLDLPVSAEERANDRIVLVILMFDAVLLALFELMFVSYTVGAIPIPISAVVALLTNPWLIRAAGGLRSSGRLAICGPYLAWLVIVLVGGFTGPGGDMLMPVVTPLWQLSNLSVLLLIVLGMVPGAYVLGRTLRAKNLTVR